jgi:hypothetical protein
METETPAGGTQASSSSSSSSKAPIVRISPRIAEKIAEADRPASTFRQLLDNHRELPSPEQAWARIEESFLSGEGEGAAPELGLRCTLETMKLLVRYYSTCPTRVNLNEPWKAGIPKGEKFELSLRQRIHAMKLGSAQRKEVRPRPCSRHPLCRADRSEVLGGD